MPPDAAWPNLPNHFVFTPADHAAHTSPKGIAYPEHLYPGLMDSRKSAKGLMKFAHKPHLKVATGRKRAVTPKRKRKHK